MRRATNQSQGLQKAYSNFYPRSPCGERQDVKYKRDQTILFLSTLSLRRATSKALQVFFMSEISIHALLAESDTAQKNSKCRCLLISIHALLAESDYTTTITICIVLKFLSTLSLRRATRTLECTYNAHVDFYPRSPCGERLVYALKLANTMLFLSTLSLRRATYFLT